MTNEIKKSENKDVKLAGTDRRAFCPFSKTQLFERGDEPRRLGEEVLCSGSHFLFLILCTTATPLLIGTTEFGDSFFL